MPRSGRFRFIELIEVAQHRVDGLGRSLKYVLEHEITQAGDSVHYLIRPRPLMFITDVNTAEGFRWQENIIDTNYQVEARVDHKNRRVSFSTPEDSFVIDHSSLRCRGVGCYVLLALVKWARHHFPSYPLSPIPLGDADSETPETSKIRNDFFESLGFSLSFEDEACIKGKAEVQTLGQLTPDVVVEGIKNISNARCINDLIAHLVERHNSKLEALHHSPSADLEALQDERSRCLVYLVLSILVNVALFFFLVLSL